MDIGTFLVSDAQSAKLVQPGKASFHDPAPLAEATAVLRVARRQQRQDATFSQTLPN
jgi:hypothetical protein